MKTLHLLIGLPFLALPAHAKLNLIATTPDLGAIAREIGGDRVEITTLAKPTEDPHFVDAKPSFIVKLNRADALIEGGAELEQGWLAPLLEGARNPRLAAGQSGHIDCAKGIAMLEVPTTLDRSKGDLHAAGNPHFTTDPMNGKIVATTICEALSQLEPKSADAFRANLKKFTGRLDAKMAEWQRRLEPFRGRQVVTYHNYWPYFAERFGLKTELFLEPKPGIPPTPAHLAGLVGRMKAQHVRVILVQPYVSRKSAETVAGLTGAVVLDVAAFPGGIKGGEGYIEWMDSLVNALAGAFEKSK
ncbi:MAG: zinc ABC transporter substrate-binding protein [Verrucomicrobia bacterium]|nr:zinc ABC transporter substrate-binding protein [Verrucomicrobiota bacterium]